MRPFPALFMLTLLGLTGCSKSSPPPAPPPPKVTIAQPVRKQVVEWEEFTGRLAAVQSVEIKARVSGYLRSIHFREGDLVKKDALLFVIDPRPFETELKSAEAQLKEAKAREEQADAVLRQREAELTQARAVLALAEKRKTRAERLVQGAARAASQEELDIRTSELQQARASIEAANANLLAAKAGITTAKAVVETSKVAIENAEVNLSYTQIRAPITGRIGRWEVSVGDFIQGGAGQPTLLTTIVSLDPIHCYFDANEQAVLEYLRQTESGSRGATRDIKKVVYLSLADEEGYPHKGHTDFVNNQLSSATASMLARAIFPNPDLILVPGMFAQLRLPAKVPYVAVLIPDEAIGTDQSDKFVYVVDDENKVKRVAVKLGPKVDGLRVVREGLTGSEKLIIQGVQRARPGITVTPEAGEIKSVEDGLPNEVPPLRKEDLLSVPIDQPPRELIEKTNRSLNNKPVVPIASK